MARPAKPDKLHVRHGTRSNVAKAEGHVTPEPEQIVQLPKPPVTLTSEIAQSKWFEVGNTLIKLGVLTETDIDALESYCISYDMVAMAKREIDKNGSTAIVGTQGGLVKIPAANVLKESQSELRQMGSLLGLNPSARTRINVGKKEDSKPDGLGALQKPRRGS